MALALRPPFPPMEARSVDEIPIGADWQYEPKWDGFRCLLFRDGNKVELQSKSGQPLTRYFPELVEAALEVPGATFVLDGEIVVPADGAFSFDALLQRIHPAPSRVRRLAEETPALLIVFDLLVGADGEALVAEPLVERRRALETFARVSAWRRTHPPVARDDTARNRQVLARARGRDARRHHRQATRRRIPAGRPQRHAEDQELSQRGLRGRRLPLQRRQAGRRLATARALRPQRPASPRRLHLDDQARGQAGAHQEARTAGRAARLHGKRTGRAQPLVDRAVE